ncbi:MAG: hypothetical protein M1814_006128 [Vezdaea aestivalis]|nr:MAG: hypothetical protein M1814_006128 [Vezdaea aestivalis]
MEARKPSEYILEVFADPESVKDVVKGKFESQPQTQDLLDLTLPCIDDFELETLVDNKSDLLVRHIDTTANTRAPSVRAQIAISFFEKRRKKAWFTKTEEEVCWEQWTINVTLATPKNESDRIKVRRAMETQLQKTALKILTVVNRDQAHIPPITTSDQNPFPYRIDINPKGDGEAWGNRLY